MGSTTPSALIACWILIILVPFVSASCIVSDLVDSDQRATREAARTTATAQAVLTDAYGVQVGHLIERFEMGWHSLEAHTDPGIQAELAVDPHLDYWGNARKGDAVYDEPFWSVITSAEVAEVHVLEHSSQHIKAVAAVGRQFAKVTPDGELLEAPSPAGRCGVYVFVREDDAWKLAVFFLMSGHPDDVKRDWHAFPESWKGIIGELPDLDLCTWH